MASFVSLNTENIDQEHICCAFSDKKCTVGYQLKKEWLKNEIPNGYIFRKLDARAKVFIEYGQAELGWAPVNAPGYLLINCFWVSGQFKGKGYAKELLNQAWNEVLSTNKNGLVTIVGSKKFHFMSDTQWLLKQGFISCDSTPDGFLLLVKNVYTETENPAFKASVKHVDKNLPKGLVVYYSNRCPFAEYYVNHVLTETVTLFNLPLQIIKFETCDQAQKSPTPATIFSLFYNGTFLTTDVSVCLKDKFLKIVEPKIS